MSKPVKPTRPYDSTRRRQQAAATRAEILNAAQRLFERQGYEATTVASIASDARVALKTVYVAFETKSGVLRALWNMLLRGDDEEIPVRDRAWYRAVLDEPDPERQLRLAAHNSRVVKLRVAAVLEVIRTAAPSDPDIEALWTRIQTEFHANQRAIVDVIGTKKALRTGLDVDRAADILWALNHPDLWQLLVVQRGWTADEYEQWCGDAACEQLLRPAPQPTGAALGGRRRGA